MTENTHMAGDAAPGGLYDWQQLLSHHSTGTFIALAQAQAYGEQCGRSDPMNHGGIGYLSYSNLDLPMDLLRPLSIGDGASVLALYYPRPSDRDNRGLSKCHDLMITPVPFRYWPVVGRLLIRLWHRQGSLARVAEWLRTRNISILNAECTRSAHRYATWNLTIAFEDLIGRRNRFNAATSEHVETVRAVQRLERDLESCFPDNRVLFREERDPGLRQAVEVLPVRTHSYFYDYAMHASHEYGQPFELSCFRSQLHSRDKRLSGLLDRLDRRHQIAPTCVVAETDTRDFNIRVALIPPERLSAFFEIVIPYRRSGGQSTKGFLASVTTTLSRQYNIWRLFNSTSQNGEDLEVGELCLCLEDRARGAPDARQLRKNLEDVISSMQRSLNRHGPKETKIHPGYHIDPITPDGVRFRLIRERTDKTGIEYDVFISYGRGDGSRKAKAVYDRLERQGLRPHLDKKEFQAGDDWIARLIDGIRQSGEVAVVCTPASLDRPWIALEVGCALSLRKFVTAIIVGDIPDGQVPDYLRRFHWVRLREDPKLTAYATTVRQRLARQARF